MKTLMKLDLISKKNRYALLAFVAFFIIALLTPRTLLESTHALAKYLPLHSLMEIFSITVSVLAFSMGWENRADNKYINTVILSITFLAVAIIDFAHVFSFPGMPEFVTPASANKSIFFWLTGRLTVAGAMLYWVSSTPRVFKKTGTKYIFLSIALAVCAAIYWFAFNHLDLLPDAFIEGQGLTPFKIYSELFVVLILLLTFIILFRRSEIFSKNYDIENTAMAISLMVMSEMFFMIFTAHADFYNFLGHIYKVLSFYYFYRALFKENIQKPYTQLDKKNQELSVAKAEAEEASIAKSQFLANVSHEIRTPMNAIIGLTELIIETQNTPGQEENLTLLRQAEEHLLNMVNNILTISRIEAGLIDLQSIEFDLPSEIHRLEGLLRVTDMKKNLEIKFSVSPEVPARVIGDLNKLNQVVINLIDNAVKFTEHGLVQFDVSATSIDANKVTILIQVSDSGIGIPADKIKLLFQNFSQIDSSNTRKYGGTGLGLAISKKLVESMHGKIWVESVLGKGSTFSFSLPFQRAGTDE